MIGTHRKNSSIKSAFSATTKIFKKEGKLFNVILFEIQPRGTNFLAFYLVWLVVWFGFVFFKKQVQRLNVELLVHVGSCAFLFIIIM